MVGLFLHCLPFRTTEMINDEYIGKMKDGVYSINTSRGPSSTRPLCAGP